MTVRFCGFRHSTLSVLAVGVLAFSATAEGPEFSFQGVPNGGGAGNIGRTSPDCTVSGDTITCPGGGRIVHFSIGISGWGDLDPDRELGTFQATIDGTSLDNGSFVLNPLNYPAGDRTVGAYQVLSTCFAGASDGLACGFSGAGPFGPGLPGVTEADCQADGGFFCAPYDDFVLACCDPIAAVSTAYVNYAFGATRGANGTFGRSDTGEVWYGGDLVLDIPVGARGTWDIQFLGDPNQTFMSDILASHIGTDCPNADCLVLLPGHLRIPTGKCCSGATVTCANDVTQEDCNGSWAEALVCTGSVHPDPADPIDCCLCAQDAECDDANACTDDVCELCACRHAANYDTSTECCNPADGSIVIIDAGACCDAADGSVLDCDDTNACTDDICTDGGCRYEPKYDPTTQCCNPADGSIVIIDASVCCNAADGSVLDCDDGDACTTDTCEAGQCQNAPNYNLSTECCDPASGSVASIDDGSPCTNCLCDEGTGEVTCSDADLCLGFRWIGVPSGGGAGNIGRTSPDCTVSGDTITCPGGGRTVHFSIGMTGWGDAIPDRELGTWQATIDGSTYDNGSGILNPINYPPGDRTVGGYQVLKTCLQGASDGLACGNAGVGPFGPGLPGVTQADCLADGGFFCTPYDGFVLACCEPIAAVSTASLNYSYGATTGQTVQFGRSDTGDVWYGGDLVLEIPAGARGTWDIAFLADPNLTFMADFVAQAIGDCSDPADCLALLPGHVRIPTGKCCSGNPAVCYDNLTYEDCGTGAWQQGRVCSTPAPAPAGPDDCSLCAADGDCDDGNACTNDICMIDGCRSVPNYDSTTVCCDPVNGAIVPVDDGVYCTDCTCDSTTGTVACGPSADGTRCDDGVGCTLNDVCAAGVCGGEAVAETPCTSDDDCPRFVGCDTETGFCACRPLSRKLQLER